MAIVIFFFGSCHGSFKVCVSKNVSKKLSLIHLIEIYTEYITDRIIINMKTILLIWLTNLSVLTYAQTPTFTSQPVNGFGFSAGAVDMNNDFLDDFVTANTSTIRIYYQQAGGGFDLVDIPAIASNSPSWSIAAGDLDGNGYNDLLYGGGSGVSFMIANSDGSAYGETTSPEFVFSQRSNFVDINNDGALDAFVCHDVAPNVYYINNGDGTLTFNQGGLGDVANGGNYGSVWIDYDNDNDQDLFIAKCRGGTSPANINELHRNNGDGTFTEVGAQAGLDDNVQTWSSAWGDYDNDGDMDGFIGASSSSNGSHKFMQNNGDGTFTDITAGSGFDVFPFYSTEHAPADFNNDGFIDILTASSSIMLNNGDMTFTPVGIGVGRGALGDLNNDGFIDIADVDDFYINDGNSNNFLVINTIGVESNLNGIGARIELQTATKTQIRDVRSGEGFRFMSTLNTHFGLGEDAEIERLTIYWPSGTMDEFDNVPINTTLTVTEGESINVSTGTLNTEDFSIYPNPSSDKIFLSLPSESLNTLASIYDITGKKVSSVQLVGNSIEIGELNAGIYFLQLTLNEVIVRKQFIKANR